MAFTKITQEDLANKGVIGLPDTPNLSTQSMQEKLDEIALDVIVPAFNNLCDELDDEDLDTKIASPNMTNIRLNSDQAIEYSDDGGTTWGQTASSGHRIMDKSGSIMAQESRMQFKGNVEVEDDPTGGKTIVSITGQKGDDGKAATISVGAVSSGDTAQVINDGTATDAVFRFVLPKGDAGDMPNIHIGQVQSGDTASVTITGQDSDPYLNFVLPKGDKGDTGQGINILGEYDTLADLETAHPTGSRGDSWMVGTTNPKNLYVWDVDQEEWVNEGALQGVKGDTGATPSFSIGTVTTGQSSSVTIGGTTDYPTLSFVLEKGDKGDTGNAATISIDSAVSGDTASVTNVGTPTNAQLAFVLPKGDKGDQGDPTSVNGKSGNPITLYATDIYTGSTLSDVPISTALSNLDTAVSGKADTTAVNNKHKVTNVPVDLTNWTQDTTSQSGSTLYKKQITLNHIYVDSPSVEIGAASGSVLPTTAQQDSYDLLLYCTADSTVPCLYLYASDIPQTAFYINVGGAD